MTDDMRGGRKLYAAKVEAKVGSSSGCSFCWFVLQLNPSLTGMSDRDTTTFREHLKRSHGLREEIQP